MLPRHNDLRDEFAALCVEVGLAVDLEDSPDNLRPVDVLVHGIEISPLAVDFSVVHPLQPSADLAEVRLESWLARSRIRRFVRVFIGMVLLSVRPRKPRVPGAAKPSS